MILIVYVSYGNWGAYLTLKPRSWYIIKNYYKEKDPYFVLKLVFVNFEGDRFPHNLDKEIARVSMIIFL